MTEADESELNFGKTSKFQYGTTRAPETFRVKLFSENLSKNDFKLEQISGPLKTPTFLTDSKITTEPSATELNSRNSENVEIITSSILNETLTNSTDEITPWHASKSQIFYKPPLLILIGIVILKITMVSLSDISSFSYECSKFHAKICVK